MTCELLAELSGTVREEKWEDVKNELSDRLSAHGVNVIQAGLDGLVNDLAVQVAGLAAWEVVAEFGDVCGV